jgi:hypothetical protein
MVAVCADRELQEMHTGPDLYEHMEVIVTKGHDKMHHGVVLSSSEQNGRPIFTVRLTTQVVGTAVLHLEEKHLRELQ